MLHREENSWLSMEEQVLLLPKLLLKVSKEL
jgi:hypothetical protein